MLNLKREQISRDTFRKEVFFNAPPFSKEARFIDTTFTKAANFHGTKLQRAVFSHAKFLNEVRFLGSDSDDEVFNDETLFGYTIFEQPTKVPISMLTST